MVTIIYSTHQLMQLIATLTLALMLYNTARGYNPVFGSELQENYNQKGEVASYNKSFFLFKIKFYSKTLIK